MNHCFHLLIKLPLGLRSQRISLTAIHPPVRTAVPSIEATSESPVFLKDHKENDRPQGMAKRRLFERSARGRYVERMAERVIESPQWHARISDQEL